MKIVFFISFLLIANATSEYGIDQFYKKIELDNETLDENGDEIDFIFVKSDIKQGRYEVDITDGPGDLYEIKGTPYYVKFRTYFGYAGYGKKGLLIVSTSAWSSKFLKYDD
jgi:hypothetical protein